MFCLNTQGLIELGLQIFILEKRKYKFSASL